MSFLEIFTLFVSGVTIFGLIVGVFSVYNGRMTRREIAGLIRETTRETQQLIREIHAETQQVIRETRDLIVQEAAATRQLIQETQAANREILLRITEILARIDERVR
jgi:ABC-type transporter Mla maintaining outer membrane lipid asymmetry permease subunit MlaE